MDAQRTDAPVTLVVEPGTQEWGTRTDRWHSDLLEVRDRLDRRLPPGSVAAATPAEGAMGLELTEVLVALGTSGAISGAVEVLKAWLAEKRKVRTLNITVRRGDQVSHLVLDSENMDSHDLAAIAQELAEKR